MLFYFLFSQKNATIILLNMKMDKNQKILKLSNKKLYRCKDCSLLPTLFFVNETVPQMGKKKKRKLTLFFLLCNIVIVSAILIYQFCFCETKPLSELFAERPFYRFFFISLGAVVLFYVVEALTYSILIKKSTGRFNFMLGMQMTIVGKYWDSITPFGSGGQIAQVAYANKKGLAGNISTSVTVGKYMIWMIAFVILGIIALCIPITTFTTGKIVKILGAVGVAINIALTLFIWAVSVNRKFCSVIVVGGLKLLYKMHIVKNYTKALRSSIKFIKQYQQSFKMFLKNPWIFISELILCALGLLLMASIAYFIYLGFHYPNAQVSPVTIIAMSLVCTFATSYIPLPGGSGAAEISFAGLFGSLFENNVVFWALIIWRIATYYILILIGFIYIIADSIIGKKKKKYQT